MLSPGHILENAKDTVMEMEDEIPLWIQAKPKERVLSKEAWDKHRRSINSSRQLKREDRARVTLVDRSILENYCNEQGGKVVKNILVVPGVHGKMEKVEREAGALVGGVIMKEWLEVREEFPELFERVSVI